MTVLGVVLAAGSGRRFGGPKALAETDGRRWVDLAVTTMQQAGIGNVLVISGAWHGDVAHAEVRHNPRWKEGLSSSVDLAIAAAQASNVEAVILTLVDLPGLKAEHVAAVLADPGPLVQASYAGTPSHPVKIAREHFSRLRTALSGDRGARAYLVANGVRELPLEGSLQDQDYSLP